MTHSKMSVLAIGLCCAAWSGARADATPVPMPPAVITSAAAALVPAANPMPHAPPGVASGLFGAISASFVASPDLTKLPYSSAGRLYVLDPNDGNKAHYCTAQFVSPNVLLTAAHCVYQLGASTPFYVLDHFTLHDDGHDTGTKFTFFDAANCPPVLPDEWKTSIDPYLRVRSDYAFIRTASNLTDPSLQLSFSGPLPQKPNPSVSSVLIGYPDAIGGGAGHVAPMRAINGMFSIDVLHPKLYAMPTSRTDFTEGISGGAWVSAPSSVANPQVNVFSLNSSFALQDYQGQSNYIIIYGPVFDSTFSLSALSTLNSCTGP